MKPGPPPRVFAFLSRAGGAELTHLRLYGSRISVVAPNWYALDVSDQTLSGAPSLAVVDLVRAAGAQLWPVVNARLLPDDAIANRAVRTRIADVIAAVAYAHGYDGITLDIEDLAVGKTDAFSALVAAVAGALHAQHEHLAVYAPRRTADGGERVYDWPALAHDADLLIASGYDEHSAMSRPGPVSTTTGFDDMLDYAEGVTRSRIAPAIGAFGYRWPVDGGAGVMLSSVQADQLRQQTGARAHTDGGDSTFRADGQIVYYQDASQLVAEARAARDDQMRWLALFSLGREPDAFWAQITTARQPLTSGAGQAARANK
jgi:spore germination protein YaaH